MNVQRTILTFCGVCMFFCLVSTSCNKDKTQPTSSILYQTSFETEDHIQDSSGWVIYNDYCDYNPSEPFFEHFADTPYVPQIGSFIEKVPHTRNGNKWSMVLTAQETENSTATLKIPLRFTGEFSYLVNWQWYGRRINYFDSGLAIVYLKNNDFVLPQDTVIFNNTNGNTKKWVSNSMRSTLTITEGDTLIIEFQNKFYLRNGNYYHHCENDLIIDDLTVFQL